MGQLERRGKDGLALQKYPLLTGVLDLSQAHVWHRSSLPKSIYSSWCLFSDVCPACAGMARNCAGPDLGTGIYDAPTVCGVAKRNRKGNQYAQWNFECEEKSWIINFFLL